MDSIDVAALKPGQTFTLELGDKEAILTKLDAPRHFKVEDFYMDETEIFVLTPVIEEDELVYYSLQDFPSLDAGLKQNEGKFGKDLVVLNFLNRPVDGIEMDEEEEEEAPAPEAAAPEASDG